MQNKKLKTNPHGPACLIMLQHYQACGFFRLMVYILFIILYETESWAA